MTGKLKKYLAEAAVRRQKLQEGRKLLEAIGEPVAQKSDLAIFDVLAGIGLAHLRAFKAALDVKKAAREMSRRIQEGPRPSRDEAHLN
ncbi:MAG: hypothetical protein ACYC6G_19030 [Desulfobaccales bacterium]